MKQIKNILIGRVNVNVEILVLKGKMLFSKHLFQVAVAIKKNLLANNGLLN